MSKTLKPCPFCGGAATTAGSRQKSHQAWCEHCSTVQMGSFFITEDDAIAAWNRRADGWIPVTERLPEVEVAVLVMHTYQCQEYSPITIGRLHQPIDKRRKPYWTFISIQASDGMVYNDGTAFICPGNEYVAHWQPLPAQPKGV